MKKYFELFSVDNLEMSLPANSKPTPTMVKTLMKCLELEIYHPGKPYGPRDIKGSFSGLYNRGLVDIKINNKKRNPTTSWFVTSEGLHFLLSLRYKKISKFHSIYP
jgi:hypothetical protein